MRLRVVGCSGSLPGPSSPASCYLVEADDPQGRTWRVVLDLGSGALGPLQGYTDPRTVDAVALSHLHADHCLDLCGLYVSLRYHPSGPPAVRLPVHGPTGTAARLARAYDLAPDPGMSAELDVREWTAGVPVRVGPLTLTPHPVEHPVEAYALRVEGPAEDDPSRRVVLAYSGDTDACPGLQTAADGADLLLAESAFEEARDATRGIHLTGLRAGESARDAGAARLVLTHLPPWNDPDVAVADARRAYDGPIDLAAPGMLLTL
ncbi:MBL fold metallo-hydrolase [Angustibacter speluncae]